MSHNEARPQDAATVVELIDRLTAQFGNVPAILDDAGELTFTQLYDAAARTAGALGDLGARVGDTIVVALGDSAASRIAEWAMLGFGFVRAAVSVRLHPREIAEVAISARAAVVLVAAELAPGVRAALAERGSRILVVDRLEQGAPARPGDVSADSPALAIFTSGTTGLPRPIAISQQTWMTQTRRSLSCLPPLGPGDVVLAVAQLPSFGGSIALNAASAGAATVLHSRFDPQVVADLVERHVVTVLPLAASMLESFVEYLAQHGRRLPSLRAVPYGGSAIDPRRLASAVDVLPGVLAQFYGLAQALAPLSVLGPEDHAVGGELLSSAGRWLPGVEHRIVDGELLVRGEVVISPDPWLRTGDRAEFRDGFLYLSGRLDDAVTTGGYTVHPAEIESVLRDVPGVGGVVVVGTPHPRWGEGLTAVAVLGEPLSSQDDHAILTVFGDACRARLASFKKPVALVRVASLPLTPVGKPDRRAARLLALATQERN